MVTTNFKIDEIDTVNDEIKPLSDLDPCVSEKKFEHNC